MEYTRQMAISNILPNSSVLGAILNITACIQS